MRRILAIDLGGFIVGWAGNYGAYLYGSAGFRPRKFERDGVTWDRFDAWFEKLLDPRPGLIVYERPLVYRGWAATRLAFGMATRIEQRADFMEIDRRMVDPSTVKLFALGRAPARKKGDPKMDRGKIAMTDAAEERLKGLARQLPGPSGLDEHQADALWMLWWAEQNGGKL